MHRSVTAEELFRDRFETRSAGLYNEHPVTEEELEWADVVFVMDDVQQTELGKRFLKTYLKKQIISLEVPDMFHHGQKELKDLLEQKMKDALPAIA